MPQICIEVATLASLVEMATSHVEDIESGLEDGTYEFNGNEDIAEKRTQLNAGFDALKDFRDSQAKAQPTEPEMTNSFSKMGFTGEPVAQPITSTPATLRRYGCFNRKPLVNSFIGPGAIVIDNVMSKDCQYSIHNDDPRCASCMHQQVFQPA